jgi:hypothetical protein
MLPHKIMPRIEDVDPVRYRDYLRFLSGVLTRFKDYYERTEQEGQITDAESVAYFAERFLATIASLRLKYMYSPSYLRRPGVDLTYSGFPGMNDIFEILSDLATCKDRLAKLPSIEALKAMILESVMMAPSVEDEERHQARLINLLYKLSDRAYLEGLDINTQFFQFTPGKLSLVPASEYAETGRRAYVFSWACFDQESNEPVVYTMLFTQDDHETVFDTASADFEKFMDTVRNIAARAPENLLAIAVRLDESFRTLYPKTIKRVRIGPLVSPLLYQGARMIDEASLAGRILPVFKRAGSGLEDFVLLFDVEAVISVREEVSSLSRQYGYEKSRQVYLVNESMSQMKRRGVSTLKLYAIMPHWLRQHLTEGDFENLPELREAELLAYQINEKGLNHVC